MKYLFLLAFICPLIVSAQDCELNKTIDPYTKQVKLSTGFIYVDGGSVTVDADNKEIIILFSLDGPEKCFDDNATVEIYFEGLKSKTQARNRGTMNCEGFFQLVFRNTNSDPTTL